jgi:hypothetical protein
MTHHLNIACSSEQITPVVADHTVQYLSHVLGSPGGHPCSPETPLDSLAHTPPPQPLPTSSIGIPSGLLTEEVRNVAYLYTKEVRICTWASQHLNKPSTETTKKTCVH